MDFEWFIKPGEFQNLCKEIVLLRTTCLRLSLAAAARNAGCKFVEMPADQFILVLDFD